MPDYSKGKIYKIECYTTGLIYIGSTCEPTIAKRLAKHNSNFTRWKKDNTKENYMTSFKVLENNNYDICLIETYQLLLLILVIYYVSWLTNSFAIFLFWRFLYIF